MKISINELLKFSDLNLTRDSVTGDIEMETDVIQQICSDSGIEGDQITEDLICAICIAWYQQNLESGGKTDVDMEIIKSELEIEYLTGQLELVTTGKMQ